MAISAKGIGWSNESNLLWNIWRQLERLTGVAKFSSGPQGIPGPQGEQGVQGEQGTTGETGAALTVLGSYPDLAAFLAGAGGSPGNPGDAWILLNDGSLEVWNTDTNLWDDAGDLLGPAGPQGSQGVQGEQGIQGQQGIQGVAGTNGTSGTTGTSGTSGTSGAQGPAGLPGFFAQTTDSTPVTATTVETTIIGPGVGTLTVPANGFSIGDSFQASLDGILSCVGTATLHIHVKTLTGVILADTGIIAMETTTSKSWLLNLYFTVRNIGGTTVASISSGGLFSYIKNSGTNFEGYVLNTLNNTTFNTTINNTLVITAQWNTTNAGNTILSRNFTLTKVY